MSGIGKFFNPIMGLGLKLHPFINPTFGEMCKPCPGISKKV